jgi:hypothetical protein
MGATADQANCNGRLRLSEFILQSYPGLNHARFTKIVSNFSITSLKLHPQRLNYCGSWTSARHGKNLRDMRKIRVPA